MAAIKSKQVKLTVTEQYLRTGAGGRHASPFEGFAHGGTTPAFEPFRVHDGEVMWDDKQHYVSTKAQTEALARAGSGGGGGGRAPVNLTVQIGTTTLRRILIDDALGRGVSSATVQAAYP